jgi:hypothetical protein
MHLEDTANILFFPSFGNVSNVQVVLRVFGASQIRGLVLLGDCVGVVSRCGDGERARVSVIENHVAVPSGCRVIIKRNPAGQYGSELTELLFQEVTGVVSRNFAHKYFAAPTVFIGERERATRLSIEEEKAEVVRRPLEVDVISEGDNSLVKRFPDVAAHMGHPVDFVPRHLLDNLGELN